MLILTVFDPVASNPAASDKKTTDPVASNPAASDKKTTDPVASNSPASDKKATDSVASNHPALNLEGTWSSDCFVEIENNKKTYIFSGSLLTETQVFFGFDSTCIDSKAVFSVTKEGTFATGEEITSSVGFRKIDMTVSYVEYTPLVDYAVNTFNTLRFYGYSDWVVGTPKRIEGKKKTPDAPDSSVIHANSKIFDIIKVSGITLTKGKKTQTIDGKTEATRPTTADNVTYTKIK